MGCQYIAIMVGHQEWHKASKSSSC